MGSFFSRSHQIVIFPSEFPNQSNLSFPGAAAYICGEFRAELKEPRATLDAMVARRGLQHLPGNIQGVFLQNMLKILTRVMEESEEQSALEVSFTYVIFVKHG